MTLFVIPDDFEWLPPWQPLRDESLHMEMGRAISQLAKGEGVADSLAAELLREMAEGHKLHGLSLRAVAYCQADPNEFVFVTNDPKQPIACVHLTWERESDPLWPYTYSYTSLSEWAIQMRSEHDGWNA